MLISATNLIVTPMVTPLMAPVAKEQSLIVRLFAWLIASIMRFIFLLVLVFGSAALITVLFCKYNGEDNWLLVFLMTLFIMMMLIPTGMFWIDMIFFTQD